VAFIVFPKLALGLSGFETGVAVMSLVRGRVDDTPERPKGRIRDTRKLLTAAALIMSGFLVTSSFATTVLIPHQQFEQGGKASGRALAYLAHQYLGNGFGTVYDLSTVCILWFAGASAMAGLLNIVPRYLPRYGMAQNGPAQCARWWWCGPPSPSRSPSSSEPTSWPRAGRTPPACWCSSRRQPWP
jgi:amino acid transporter